MPLSPHTSPAVISRHLSGDSPGKTVARALPFGSPATRSGGAHNSSLTKKRRSSSPEQIDLHCKEAATLYNNNTKEPVVVSQGDPSRMSLLPFTKLYLCMTRTIGLVWFIYYERLFILWFPFWPWDGSFQPDCCRGNLIHSSMYWFLNLVIILLDYSAKTKF